MTNEPRSYGVVMSKLFLAIYESEHFSAITLVYREIHLFEVVHLLTLTHLGLKKS